AAIGASGMMKSGCRSRLPTVGGMLSAGTDLVSQAALGCRNRRWEGENAMCSAGLNSPAGRWLIENGPRELELLFRAIVFHPSAPILITDSAGNSIDASVGVGKLLGLSRERIIGHPIDDFAQP